ncbi:MAG: SDR family NAD(P)-dependent oxidoreductase [Rhodobacter sp.]|nr:SDR family NAD(P)-dependent oxidoreductase [Rhodobacter sp.]
MAQRSILITGCSSGIGYDAAHTLNRRGWRVFASCRKAADCARLIDEGLDSPRIDYEDPESVEQGAAEVLAATGGTLDALFNNGAYGIPAAVEDLPRAAFSAILQANLVGPHHLTTQVIPAMRAVNRGRIVNCTSVMGFTAYPWRGAYVATKYALEGLTDTLRIELHDTNIHVSLIEPGLITTKFGENSGRNFERWIDWEKSLIADKYRTDLLKKWEGENPNAWLEVPAAHVTRKLIHAVENPRPRARYRVTKLAEFAYVAKRLLPTRAADWLIRRTT